MADSLQGFISWATSTKQVSNPTTNTANQYPGQCVSLIQAYLWRVFGIPYAPRGNAKDFVPPTFVRVTGTPQPGDIIRYGANYGGGYGHIGMVNDSGTFTDQNGVVALHVGERSVPWSGIESIWRPTLQFRVKVPAETPAGITAEKGTATVQVATLNVRAAASTSSEIVAKYVRGQKFAYDGYVIANGYVWLTYVAYSGARRYVAEGPYDGNAKNIYVSGGVS